MSVGRPSRLDRLGLEMLVVGAAAATVAFAIGALASTLTGA